jgi:hypothetical protein
LRGTEELFIRYRTFIRKMITWIFTPYWTALTCSLYPKGIHVKIFLLFPHFFILYYECLYISVKWILKMQHLKNNENIYNSKEFFFQYFTYIWIERFLSTFGIIKTTCVLFCFPRKSEFLKNVRNVQEYQ